MKLGDEQKRKIESHLESVTKGGFTCPICGSSQWVFNETLSEIRTFSYGKISLQSLIPLVVATCKTCSYVVTFNALQLGLLEQEGTDDDA